MKKIMATTNWTAGQTVALIGIVIVVASFFVATIPLLPIGVIVIGSTKFIP